MSGWFSIKPNKDKRFVACLPVVSEVGEEEAKPAKGGFFLFSHERQKFASYHHLAAKSVNNNNVILSVRYYWQMWKKIYILCIFLQCKLYLWIIVIRQTYFNINYNPIQSNFIYKAL